MEDLTKYNEYIRFLANNIDHNYGVVKYIYEKESKLGKPCYRVYNKVEALETLKEQGKEDLFERDNVYNFKNFNFETNKEEYISYYTNKNLLKYDKEYLSNEDIEVILDKMIDIYSMYFINIEFSENINSFNATDINLEDNDLMIILPESSVEEKIYNLISLFITLAINVNDDFNLKVLSELVIYSLDIDYKSDCRYKPLVDNEWICLFELSKLMNNHLQEMMINDIKFKFQSFDELNSMDLNKSESVNFDSEDFKKNIEDFYNLLNKSGLDPLIDTLDDFNILQSYKLWSLGNKEEYLDKMGTIVKNNDNSINELISKIKYFNEEKIYAELLRQQQLLQGV